MDHSFSFLPSELKNVIGTEAIDFAVKAKRYYFIGSAIFPFIFGLGWLAGISFLMYQIVGPLLYSEEFRLRINGVWVTVSRDNLEPVMSIIVVLVIFLIISLAIIGLGFFILFRRGSYFVGTETRLIEFRNGTVKSTEWTKFLDSAKVHEKHGTGMGYVILELNRKRSNWRFISNYVEMIDIPNAYEIEQKCKARLEGNPKRVTKTNLN